MLAGGRLMEVLEVLELYPAACHRCRGMFPSCLAARSKLAWVDRSGTYQRPTAQPLACPANLSARSKRSAPDQAAAAQLRVPETRAAFVALQRHAESDKTHNEFNLAIGSANVCTTVTNAQLVCRLLL